MIEVKITCSSLEELASILRLPETARAHTEIPAAVVNPVKVETTVAVEQPVEQFVEQEAPAKRTRKKKEAVEEPVDMTDAEVVDVPDTAPAVDVQPPVDLKALQDRCIRAASQIGRPAVQAILQSVAGSDTKLVDMTQDQLHSVWSALEEYMV